MDEHAAGIAMAVAMDNKVVVGSERFGMAANWGTYEGEAHAPAITAMGALGQNFVTPRDRCAVSARVGVG